MTPQTDNRRRRIRQDELICRIYCDMKNALHGYILKRIGNRSDVEDLSQEVFVRLLEYNTLLTEQTLVNLIYTIARNQVIDYLRHHARSRKAMEYFALRHTHLTNTTEEQIAANELECLERRCISDMSPRKAEIYVLYVHEGFSVTDISERLSLSRRTVENHIFNARLSARSALRKAL